MIVMQVSMLKNHFFSSILLTTVYFYKEKKKWNLLEKKTNLFFLFLKRLETWDKTKLSVEDWWESVKLQIFFCCLVKILFKCYSQSFKCVHSYYYLYIFATLVSLVINSEKISHLLMSKWNKIALSCNVG